MSATDKRLETWHKAVFDKDDAVLASLLADDVQFNSPFVWTPKEGKDQTHFILSNVGEVFEDFSYDREWVDGADMALEFAAKVGDVSVKGVDLIHWNEEGKIDHFEVMIRPIKALNAVAAKMGERIEAAKKAGKM